MYQSILQWLSTEMFISLSFRNLVTGISNVSSHGLASKFMFLLVQSVKWYIPNSRGQWEDSFGYTGPPFFHYYI